MACAAVAARARRSSSANGDAPQLASGLGENLGGVFEAELSHYSANEWATTSEDVLWRRIKLDLHLDPEAKARVAAWFGEASAPIDDLPLPGHRFATPGGDAALI